MSKQSAGILLFRYKKGTLELLLVHPGGPFFAKKDIGAWSIPKGEFVDEQPLTAAKREVEEEIGFSIIDDSKLIPLTPLKQNGGKTIFAWALEGDLEVNNIKSNTFEIEWPPKSGKKVSFPEVDRVEWFSAKIALNKMNQGQIKFVYELLNKLGVDNLDNIGNENTNSGESQLTFF